MAPRSGMVPVIWKLRQMTATIGNTDGWSDDSLQEILDQHCVIIDREELAPVWHYTGAGTISYNEYRSTHTYIEAGNGFELEFAAGDTVGTALYSMDYNKGTVGFTADTLGSAVMMNGLTYELHGAAADVWYQRAGTAAELFNMSSQEHSSSKSVLVNNYLRMAASEEAKAPIGNILVGRSDAVNYGSDS